MTTTKKYYIFLFFLLNFCVLIQASEQENFVEKLIKDSLPNTNFSTFLPTLACIKSPNVFSIKDQVNNNKFVRAK